VAEGEFQEVKPVNQIIRSLKQHKEFNDFTEYLIELRKRKLEDLEESAQAIPTHKLQGYALALRDLIKLIK
tara:strand:+ start:1020 stop:1232 length:213 start_codon:yes stop_codon:yes gene_type:complete